MTLNSIFTNLHLKLNNVFLQVLIPVVNKNNNKFKCLNYRKENYYTL